MRAEDFFRFLVEGMNGPMIVTLSPGPFEVQVSETDVHAANLIRALTKKVGDDGTLGDIEHLILTGLLARIGEIPDEGPDGETIHLREVWEDKAVRVFLTAWWWMEFFAAQNNGYTTWRSVRKWMVWPLRQVQAAWKIMWRLRKKEKNDKAPETSY